MKQDYAEMNNVSSQNQLHSSQYVQIYKEAENAPKILFVGNSITHHAPKPEIGWNHDWGMAASSRENDYVHRVISGLKERWGPVNYCVAQAAIWEQDFPNGQALLQTHYLAARAFEADWVVIRLGENVPPQLRETVDIKPCYEQMISFFASNPNAKVIVTDNFWAKEAFDKQLAEIAKEHGYLFCQLHDLSEDQRTMSLGLFEHRGVSLHPGDFGMECIARRILMTIQNGK